MILTTRKSGFSHRRHNNKRKVIFLLIAFAVILFSGIYLFRGLQSLVSDQEDSPDIFTLWEHQRYEQVNEQCEILLQKNPMDKQALTMNGFAYFYRGTSKFSLEEQLPYFDNAIVNLRKADIIKNNPYSSQIKYVLGKAYYNKGKYYSDLSILYLESALSAGYEAIDIFEYLGLSYNSLGNYTKALEYFILAKETNPSDMLFLAIGQTYVIIEDYVNAQEYLVSAINKTTDHNVIQKGRSLLGQLFFDTGDYEKAIEQYEEILKINPRSADAYYHLGVIYDTLNETVKARAQWRRALEIEPAHHGSLLKLYN